MKLPIQATGPVAKYCFVYSRPNHGWIVGTRLLQCQAPLLQYQQAQPNYSFALATEVSEASTHAIRTKIGWSMHDTNSKWYFSIFDIRKWI